MKATLHTNHGDIVVTLFPNEAPKTVANFVGLATGEKDYRDDAKRTNPTKFYDGLVFHRIISGFMIQGGCPLGQGYGGPGFTFDDEPHPDKTFGEVADAPSRAIVDAIAAVRTDRNDRPLEPVVIESVTVDQD